MDNVKTNNLSVDFKKEAKDLLGETKEKMIERIKEKFGVSADTGIKFSTAVIEAFKEENRSVVEDYNKFCNICDNAIAAMRESIQDHNLSNEEIEKISLRIEDIIEKIDNARKEKLDYSRETRNKILDNTKDILKDAMPPLIRGGAALIALKIVLGFFKK